MTESQVVETHIRKRGFFGWIFLVVFWAFNAFMAAWAWATVSLVSQIDVGHSEAARTGRAIGGIIDAGMIGSLWLIGAVILSLCVFFSRGKKTVFIKHVAAV